MPCKLLRTRARLVQSLAGSKSYKNIAKEYCHSAQVHTARSCRNMQNCMQLEDTIAPKTWRVLWQTPSRICLLSVHQKIWDTSNSSDNLETDLGTWGPHQNSQSLPLLALGPCLGTPPKIEGPVGEASHQLTAAQVLSWICSWPGRQAAAGPSSSSAD